MSGLPNGWMSVSLETVGDFSGGLTPSKANADYWENGTIPWVSPKDMKVLTLTDSEDHVSDKALQDTNLTLCPENSVIIVVRSGILAHTLPVAINTVPVTLNQDMKAIRPHRGILPNYMAWFLRGSQKAVLDTTSKDGTTVASIEMPKLRRVEVPIAPLNEQRRIVAEIEKQFTRLDAAVEALRRVQANLKRYRASVLKAACGGKLVPTEAALAKAEGRSFEPASELLKRILKERRKKWEETELAKLKAKGKVPDDGWKKKYKEPAAPDTSDLPELPEGWCWASLEAITSAVRVICYGILMPKENVSEGVLFVKVKDMVGDRIALDQLHRTRPEIAAKYARASLQEGDLLVAIRGTYGRVCEVPKELNGGNITQDTARVDVVPPLEAHYVATALRAPDVQNFFKRVARGVAVKGVNIGDLRQAPIAVPPLFEQQRVANEADRQLSVIEETSASIQQLLIRAERLRQAVLKHAFEGKLVAQDPSDEPASLLLERIRAEREAQGAAAKGRNGARRKVKQQHAPEKPRHRRGIVYLRAATDTYFLQKIGPNAPMGEVKLEKFNELAEYHCGVPLEREPVRNAAGPVDYPALRNLESLAAKKGWFTTIRRRGSATQYRLGAKAAEGIAVAERFFWQRKASADQLIDIMRPMKTQQAEIVATLYAAWNDLLLDGKQPTDEEIIQEATVNWHEAKQRIDPKKWPVALGWMREKGLVPKGTGQKTVRRKG